MADSREPTSKPEDVLAANTLAVKFYSQISKSQADKTKNLVVSPPLILQSLFEIYHGTHGTTKKELEKVFSAPPETLAAVLEDIEDILKHGKKDGERDYDFFGGSKMVRGCDFKDKEEIDSLVGSLTNERIAALEQDLSTIQKDKNAVLLLSLAHFTADWENQFVKKANATYENQRNEPFQELLSTVENFHNADGSIAKVVMVHLEARIFLTRDEDLKVTIAEIPMEKYSMNLVIVVPDDEKNGLKNFEEKFDASTFGILQKNWQMPLTHVYLPKFSLESQTSLLKPLQNLGVKEVFSNSADWLLSDMCGGSKLHVADIVHASNIDISCECGKALPPREPRCGECRVMEPCTFAKGFHVNRPFFFLVQPRHPQVWCLMGKVQNLMPEFSHHVRQHHRHQTEQQEE